MSVSLVLYMYHDFDFALVTRREIIYSDCSVNESCPCSVHLSVHDIIESTVDLIALKRKEKDTHLYY